MGEVIGGRGWGREGIEMERGIERESDRGEGIGGKGKGRKGWEEK